MRETAAWEIECLAMAIHQSYQHECENPIVCREIAARLWDLGYRQREHHDAIQEAITRRAEAKELSQPNERCDCGGRKVSPGVCTGPAPTELCTCYICNRCKGGSR